MNQSVSRNRIIFVCGLSILLLVYSLFLSSCAPSPAPSPVETGQAADDLRERYQQAVADAEVAEAGEVYPNLVAIDPDNPALIWKGEGEEQRVLMVTWTSDGRYNTREGEQVQLEDKVWVTAVPELKTFCTTYEGGNLALRLEQLLGLPPDSNKTRFVEFWVNPEDMFRPSPDPEIDDRIAQIDFSPDAPEAYRSSFSEFKNQSYGENGYPWTRLGYTYDWGNPETEIGLSEFVIRRGATVEVASVSETRQYCGQSEPSEEVEQMMWRNHPLN